MLENLTATAANVSLEKALKVLKEISVDSIFGHLDKALQYVEDGKELAVDHSLYAKGRTFRYTENHYSGQLVDGRIDVTYGIYGMIRGTSLYCMAHFDETSCGNEFVKRVHGILDLVNNARRKINPQPPVTLGTKD